MWLTLHTLKTVFLALWLIKLLFAKLSPSVRCCIWHHRRVCSNTVKRCYIPDRSYRQGDIFCVFFLPLALLKGCALFPLWMARCRREEERWGESVRFKGRHSRAAACVPLSAAGSAVVLQRGFGKSLPLEVNSKHLPVPALTDNQHSRHFPCSISSVDLFPHNTGVALSDTIDI